MRLQRPHEQTIFRRLSHDKLAQLNASLRNRCLLLILVDKAMIWRAPRDGRPGLHQSDNQIRPQTPKQ